jgi:carboxyl-terminal processing protease
MALALAGSVQVPASTGVLPSGSIIPTDSQRSTARKVGRILEDQHYSRAAIDDKMSDVVYQRYLEFLDGQRSYFLASDISDFNIYR